MPVEPSVSGANVIQTRRALEVLVGADAVARALSSVPRETADAYSTVTPVGWVPVRDVDAVTCALAAASPTWTPERLVRESARMSVETLLAGLWRVMLRFTSDEALVARTPVIYAKTFNVGRLESTIPRRGSADLTHSGWATISDLQIIGLAGGIETVLRCAGRADAIVTSKRTPAGASFTARWTP